MLSCGGEVGGGWVTNALEFYLGFSYSTIEVLPKIFFHNRVCINSIVLSAYVFLP